MICTRSCAQYPSRFQVHMFIQGWFMYCHCAILCAHYKTLVLQRLLVEKMNIHVLVHIHVHTQLYRLTIYALLCTFIYIALHNDIVTIQHTVKPYFGSQSKFRSCTFLLPCWILLISVLEYPKQWRKKHNL